jgi:hypothetical protein
MTRSATARHRVVHQDQLTGLEDKILGYFAIPHARARFSGAAGSRAA